LKKIKAIRLVPNFIDQFFGEHKRTKILISIKLDQPSSAGDEWPDIQVASDLER